MQNSLYPILFAPVNSIFIKIFFFSAHALFAAKARDNACLINGNWSFAGVAPLGDPSNTGAFLAERGRRRRRLYHTGMEDYLDFMRPA